MHIKLKKNVATSEYRVHEKKLASIKSFVDNKKAFSFHSTVYLK